MTDSIQRTQRTQRTGASSRTARLLPLAALAATLGACGQGETTLTHPEAEFFRGSGPNQGTFYGAAVPVGQGTARTYLSVENGVMVEIGVALSESAMQGLPAGSGHSDGSHAHYNEYLLRMHPQNPTPYQFVELNWNPDGHEPDGIYTVPHFDIHFYTISLAERNAIDPADPLWEQKANRAPAPELIPERYVPAGPPIPGIPLSELAVPRMGVHWIDVTSPELGGAPFETTFIYGSWDGKIIFTEPMVTRAFLLQKPNFQQELPVAQQGYNPRGYRVYWNEQTKEYRVALTGLPAR
jgi:hypothetical protein